MPGVAAGDSEAWGARLRLLTPGPAEVPQRLRAAAVADIHHHSTAAYHAIEEQVREGLTEVMGTGGEVVLLPAPGTGAVEAATRSLFRPGESVLVVRSGRFGERWADQCEAAGLRVRHLDVEWGESVTQARLEAALRGEPFDGVCVVHGETSTGARADLSMVGSCIAGRALLVVDAIGTLGLDELQMDAWSVDAAVGAAQKGLLGFPGLSWVALGPRARERATRAGTDAYYLDLDRHLRAMRNGTHVCTPAIVQTVGLRESLEELRAYGWTEVLCRVQALSEAFRRSAAAVG
ncbi:MAG: alanine--glyoxylate aminotransferase family protein, partial [Chloroflexi bacterium]